MSRSVKMRKNVVQDMLRDERGVIAVMFAILLPLFVALAALAIDMTYAYKVRNTTQVTSSASALAGVSQLNDANSNDDPNDDDADGNDSEDYRREAIEYAYRNMSPVGHGNVVSAACGSYDPATGEAGFDDLECGDIKAGHWDGATFHAWDGPSYIPATMEIDALRVQTHRAEVNGNPLQLFLAAALGMAETDINTAAVATTGGGEISNGCLIALNNDAGEDETFHLNGGASVTTVGCDIRVDQCCTKDDTCKKGALHANGITEVEVYAEPCPVDDLECVPETGYIDVCGTVLSQGANVILDPEPDCTYDPEDGSNFVQCADAPSYDSYDPMSGYVEDSEADWATLADPILNPCDYNDFVVTDIDKEGTASYSGNPEDVTSVTQPKLDPDGNPVVDPDTGDPILETIKTYTLHPGIYCGDGKKNSKAIKFAGGGSAPNIIFSDDDDGQGIYVIKDGKMDLAGSGELSCDPCGFYLTGYPATLDWTGSNDIDLTASSDVDSLLYGLLVVQDWNDPPTPEDQEIKIAGSNEGGYYGGFYVPNADVRVVGTAGNSASEAGDCLYIIADELEFSGGATLNANNSCGSFGGAPFSPAPLFYTLVH